MNGWMQQKRQEACRRAKTAISPLPHSQTRVSRTTSSPWLILAASVVGLFGLPFGVSAQQVTSTVPGYRVGDSFHEMFGLHWGFRLGGPGGGVFFDNGGFGGAAPAFGGFDPNSAARFGFARGGTNGGFYLDFIASQGSNRSIVSQSPLLTLPNGGAGAFYNSTLTPFVTGWVPVVGQNPVEERLSRLRQGDKGGPRDDVQVPLARPITNDPANVAAPGNSPDADSPDATQPAGEVPPLVGRGHNPGKTEGTVRVTRDAGKQDARVATSGPSANGRSSPVVSDPLVVGAGRTDGASQGAGGATSENSQNVVSTAVRGDLSVAEIRRRNSQESAAQDHEVDQLVAQARDAERQGKLGVAKIYYQQASRRATGERQRELAAKAQQLTR